MKYEFKKKELHPLRKGHLKMGASNPEGEMIEANNLYLTRAGKPWIPVMGEYQFARAKREDWSKELAKIKAGGITIVSTYIFWIYHEETEGEMDFTGDLDLRAFVLACKEEGLEVLLRIGPWIHGECRNGGFPDWLLKKPYPLRTNHPEYLARVKQWYERIVKETEGLLYKDGGNIIGVQLENELRDDAEHLGTLKQLAVECGIDVPLYTVTGWSTSPSGTLLPEDEVLPVFGGYCEAPWARLEGPMKPTAQWFFTHVRNDSSIGSDWSVKKSEDGKTTDDERYPYLTCELGGGIPMTHHRRPIVRPMDIYTLGLTRLGDGNNLPGYYVYHGGTNKIGKLSTYQESIASGYPNDYSILNYDFQAPISEYGETREWYGLLTMQNLFVHDFQEELAPMQMIGAVTSPGRDDTTSLRYVMRTDGESGFVFVNHYQRLSKLADLEDVVLDTGNVVFPPISVQGEIGFYLPFQMKVGNVVLEYATAQPICKTEDTVFFAEIPRIEAQYRLTDGREYRVKAGKTSVIAVGGIQVVTLTWEEARYLRKLDDGKIYLGEDCDLYWYEQKLQVVQEGEHTYWCWENGTFTAGKIGEPLVPLVVTREILEEVPDIPVYTEELQIGCERKLTWEKISVDGAKGFVEISDDCDVAQIYADGNLVADNFYYGMTWRVPARLLYGKECYLVLAERKEDFYKEF